jgi:asparagine synthase (glutamine-hydrolysing)
MCGIAGIVTAGGGTTDLSRDIAAMTGRLVHRGPDGSGTWVGDGVALGQRRLSIIDLSDNGRQPMASADGALQLVCNGEIYNYRDLRREAAPGYGYSSGTDVEVILPLYEQHGERAVEHLVGMFAIGLWDAPRRRLLLARDRIGEKPLYYAERDGKIAFASEIKALLALPWIDRTPDEEAVTHLFAYQSLPAPFTIYRGIRQLAPGELLVWENGVSTRHTYWRVDFEKTARAWPRAEAHHEYGRLLRDAVKGQLIADVPVGVMFSGGIDSTTIARFATEQAEGVRTFCIGGGPDDEEHARAAVAAKILGTTHKNIVFGTFGLPDLVRVIAHYDQPMSSLVSLYADALARQMRAEVKVVLTGNGADEVFAGYAAYPKLAPLGMLRRLIAPVAPLAAHLVPSAAGEGLRQLVATARSGVAEWRGNALTAAARTLMGKVTTDAFARRWAGAEPGKVVADVVRGSNARSILQAATISDLMVSHQHGHAVIADMSGMTHGLELRSPFLDHRVVEFAASLQPALQVGRLGRPADAKLIAKEHLREVMPASIIDARKIGFGYGIPLDTLLRQHWRPALEPLLTKGRYLELGVFSAEGARWALDHSPLATCLLVSFAIFAEVHLFGASPEELGERLNRNLNDVDTARHAA